MSIDKINRMNLPTPQQSRLLQCRPIEQYACDELAGKIGPEALLCSIANLSDAADKKYPQQYGLQGVLDFANRRGICSNGYRASYLGAMNLDNGTDIQKTPSGNLRVELFSESELYQGGA